MAGWAGPGFCFSSNAHFRKNDHQGDFLLFLISICLLLCSSCFKTFCMFAFVCIFALIYKVTSSMSQGSSGGKLLIDWRRFLLLAKKKRVLGISIILITMNNCFIFRLAFVSFKLKKKYIMNWISIIFGHSLMFRVSDQPTNRLGVVKVTNRNATQFNVQMIESETCPMI